MFLPDFKAKGARPRSLLPKFSTSCILSLCEERQERQHSCAQNPTDLHILESTSYTCTYILLELNLVWLQKMQSIPIKTSAVISDVPGRVGANEWSGGTICAQDEARPKPYLHNECGLPRAKQLSRSPSHSQPAHPDPRHRIFHR
jgi:hypothetical protein